MAIFSKNINNTGRQIEIDLLRGFSALIMVICHVGYYLCNLNDTGLYTFCDIIGSELVAPIFMSLMGTSMVYSHHQNPFWLFKRGVYLFILGYILSFFRSILPLWIFGNVNEWTSIEAFFVVDILQFAGLSFILFSLFKKLKLPSFIILLISIGMVIVDQFIMLPESISWNSELLTGLVNLFCPVTEWSCFPLLTWFFFPAFGLFLGDLLIRCVNKKTLYIIFIVVGFLGIAFVYGNFIYLYPNYTSYYWGNNFYYMGIKNVLLTCCFVIFGLAFWYFIGEITPKFVNNFLIFLSKNLNIYYIISWLIISLLIHIKTVLNIYFSVVLIIVMTILVIIASIFLAYLYLKIKFNIKKRIKKSI